VSKKIGIVGCGNIGRSIAKLLGSKYDIHVFDKNFIETEDIPVKRVKGDFTNTAELDRFIKDKAAIVNSAPFFANHHIVASCSRQSVAYLDLSEDKESCANILQVAANASSAFIPQCGLAPGAVNIITNNLVNKFDSVDKVELRVGALPLFPNNLLKYYFTWSIDGLINEYCNPCDVIVDGKLTTVPPLSDLEELIIDGSSYEAFSTSGGVGSLCTTLSGKVKHLNYKTIRYPGHQQYIKFMLEELDLRNNRDVLLKILQNAVPYTNVDKVIILVKITGNIGSDYVERAYYKQIQGNDELSAIQLTTASGLCAMLEYSLEHELAGFIRQEDIGWEAYRSSEFGAIFLD